MKFIFFVFKCPNFTDVGIRDTSGYSSFRVVRDKKTGNLYDSWLKSDVIDFCLKCEKRNGCDGKEKSGFSYIKPVLLLEEKRIS